MFKSFGEDRDLYINHDKIIAVAIVFKNDDKGNKTEEEMVILLCVDNHEFTPHQPEGLTAREFAERIVSEINRAKAVLIESTGLTPAKLLIQRG